MTKKEQALSVLENLKYELSNQVGSKYCRAKYEAINYAIEVLEQPTSDDCVDRNHVIATISHHHFDKDKDNFDLLVHNLCKEVKALPPVTPTQSWIPLVWDEYPTVDSDGNDDYVYAVDYSVPMPKEDEWVLITDENHNVVKVQYDGYDFGDYARENILAWQQLPKPYEEK